MTIMDASSACGQRIAQPPQQLYHDRLVLDQGPPAKTGSILDHGLKPQPATVLIRKDHATMSNSFNIYKSLKKMPSLTRSVAGHRIRHKLHRKDRPEPFLDRLLGRLNMLGRRILYSVGGEEPAITRPVRVDNFNEVKPHDAPNLPGMISEAEGRYLYWLASQHYQGKGAVVEVGSWLGRSTTYLASGLTRNRNRSRLHCFDHFQWAANWNHTTNVNLPDKADFLPIFLENIQRYQSRIAVHRTKIRDLRWSDGPVEILFLDAPKRLADIAAVLSEFADSLIPKCSIIVFQDFSHGPSFEIAAAVSSLGRYLKPLHTVYSGSTVAFQVTRRIPRWRVSKAALDFYHWDVDFARKIWQTWQVVVSDERRGTFTLGLAMLLHDLDALGPAREIMQTLRDDPILRMKFPYWKNTTLYDRYKPLFEAFGEIR